MRNLILWPRFPCHWLGYSQGTAATRLARCANVTKPTLAEPGRAPLWSDDFFSYRLPDQRETNERLAQRFARCASTLPHLSPRWMAVPQVCYAGTNCDIVFFLIYRLLLVTVFFCDQPHINSVLFLGCWREIPLLSLQHNDINKWYNFLCHLFYIPSLVSRFFIKMTNFCPAGILDSRKHLTSSHPDCDTILACHHSSVPFYSSCSCPGSSMTNGFSSFASFSPDCLWLPHTWLPTLVVFQKTTSPEKYHSKQLTPFKGK